MYIQRGELAAAALRADELEAVSQATGIRVPPYVFLSLAARYGREADALALFDATTEAVVERGEGGALTFVRMATAILYNGLSRYEEAFIAAELASEDPCLWFTWIVYELVEAAARTGRRAAAEAALEQLSEMAAVTPTDLALGIEARSRALLSEGEEAEGLYRKAIERLARTCGRIELARSHLLYGEWLRRGGRRVDAREQLRVAHDMLDSFGAEAFAARAARELAATGEHVSKRSGGRSDDLTAQEAQIARLARDAQSNREIGEQLFISQHTVAYHLRRCSPS